MTNPLPLQDKIAWVTGAARGIGAATAVQLAQQGATVHLTDVRDCAPVAGMIAANGSSAFSHTLDVTQAKACTSVADGIMEAHGRLDILVANAGICPAGTVVGNREQWSRVMAVNLDGTQNCVEASWQPMVDNASGVIVIVSSMAYYQGGLIVGTEYSASKAALVGMTRHLARNGGPLGIRCNAVAPGIIDTPMTRDFDKPDLEQIPLRRLGKADDVAAPISFLCGPASAYITGTVLNVTGGMVIAA